MELILDEEILTAYGFKPSSVTIQQIGSGHINRTYLLSIPTQTEQFILQQLNTKVFKDPTAIAENIDKVASFLKTNHPDYVFPAPLPTINGKLMFIHGSEHWRLLPFIANTTAYNVLTDTKQAYEAAKQFGKLSSLLKDFNVSSLKPTIVKFHDLSFRYEEFISALANAPVLLKKTAEWEIDLALNYKYVGSDFEYYTDKLGFPDRVTHHDTKISNVLLDNANKGICVIDLDTLMPGKYISDLGDMMRTYLCAWDENEVDLTKVKIRLPYFKATVEGYLSEMGNSLTITEKELILFSGKYIIYMQALRFLTDYLNGNVYYPISYPSQNLDRTKNQFKLLSELFENKKVLQEIIEKTLAKSKA